MSGYWTVFKEDPVWLRGQQVCPEGLGARSARRILILWYYVIDFYKAASEGKI